MSEENLPRLHSASLLFTASFDAAAYEEKLFKRTLAPTEPTRPKTVEDVLHLFAKHKGVVGVMVMDTAGKIVTSNLNGSLTGMYCGISKEILDTMRPLVEGATSGPNGINLIRVNSCAQEVIIAPIAGENFIFVIVQNPEDRPSIASCTITSRVKVNDSASLEQEETLPEPRPPPPPPSPLK